MTVPSSNQPRPPFAKLASYEQLREALYLDWSQIVLVVKRRIDAGLTVTPQDINLAILTLSDVSELKDWSRTGFDMTRGQIRVLDHIAVEAGLFESLQCGFPKRRVTREGSLKALVKGFAMWLFKKTHSPAEVQKLYQEHCALKLEYSDAYWNMRNTLLAMEKGIVSDQSDQK